MAFEYDCAGWATKSGVKCDDGRTILKNAFRSDIKNGKVVPIVYQHDHKNPDMILGHALLENRDDGVYAYCKFNDSENGQLMKNRVHDGDVTQFSIYANRLKQTNRKEVFHGCIRELSLVLSGANPEAIIDKPYVLKHSDIYDEEFECDDGYIYAGSDYADITAKEGIIEHGFKILDRSGGKTVSLAGFFHNFHKLGQGFFTADFHFYTLSAGFADSVSVIGLKGEHQLICIHPFVIKHIHKACLYIFKIQAGGQAFKTKCI